MRKLLAITLVLFTTLVSAQSQLEPGEKFPRLGTEELHFNTAMVKDSKTESMAVNNIKSKVLIKGNDIKVIFPTKTVNLKLEGDIQDVTLEGVDFIMVETDNPEMLFISKNREFVMFVGKRFTTNLFNK